MLKELQKKLKSKLAELEALEGKSDATADDFGTIKTLTQSIEDLNDQIETMEKAQAARAKAALPADSDADDVAGVGHNSGLPAAQVKRQFTVGEKFGMMGAACALAFKHKQPNPAQFLEDNGLGVLAKELFPSVQKTVNSATGSAGGFTVPTPLATEFIPWLRPNSVFMQAGPKVRPLVNGKLEIAGGLASPTADWVGEGLEKPVSDPTFRKIDMSEKKVAGITVITEQMTRWPIVDLQSQIEEGLRFACGYKWEEGVLLGAGGTAPVGIMTISGVGTRAATNSVAPTIAQIDTDLSKMTLAMRLAYLRGGRPVWFIPPRVLEYLTNLRDGIAGFAYPSLQAENPTLKRFPVLDPDVIPTNLGAGTNETTIALINMQNVMVGKGMELTMKASDQATVNIGGTQHNLWQRNEIGVLCEMAGDVEIEYAAAVQLLTAVKWGA